MAWIDNARSTMEDLIARRVRFTADDLIAVVGPPDKQHKANSKNSAIGSVFGDYRRRGLIQAVGVVQSKQPKRKGGMIRVWKAA